MTGRVLFINHDLFQSDIHFPLGPAYLAAMLEQAGAEVEIYDQAVYHQTNEELAQFLDNTEWDLIGVSFLAARYVETVKPLLEIISKHKKDAWLVVGGHGPSPIPEFILQTTPTDIIAIGEAEETIVELLDAKINNKDLSAIKGIAYKENGDIITNERRQPIKNLDKIPFPAWNLFDMQKYTTALSMFNMEKGDKIFGILTSRGCIGHCSFCYRMHKGIRLRSIDNVIEEIKILKERYGVNYFLINDELFIISKKRLFEFRDALQENGLKIKFVCDARVDLFDMGVATTLKEMGCQFVNIGFESMSQPVLDAMNKKTTVEQNIKAAEVAKKAKLPVGLNILWGCPGDTEESLRKGVAFIKKYNVDHSQLRTIRFVCPYPGSPLYYQAIKDGLLLGPGDFFKAFRNPDLITVNFIKDMGTREMYRLLYKANYELIWDYHVHNPEKLPEEEMNNLIDDFHTLFFLDHNYKFRGARHYSRKNK